MNAVRSMLYLSTAVALLTGCGGSQPPIGAPGAMPQSHAGGKTSYAIPLEGTYSHRFETGHRTFQYTGEKQVFEVPSGVYFIKVVAHGGSGASNLHREHYFPLAKGGYGGRVTAVIPVLPGEELVIYVGGNGAKSSGGFNGGGDGSIRDTPDGLGGGGASDVREHGDSLPDRILVAGGGGGAGGGGYGYAQRGYGNGGKGGGLLAGDGSPGGSTNFAAQGGAGGTQSGGGYGGAAQNGCYYYDYGLPGSPGTFGVGGSGGDGGLRSYSAGGGGGGGGGGYYGGGGGGGGGYYGGGAGGAGCYEPSDYTYSGAGGGGGSSYVEPSATGVHMWRGWKNNKHGLVVFDW